MNMKIWNQKPACMLQDGQLCMRAGRQCLNSRQCFNKQSDPDLYSVLCSMQRTLCSVAKAGGALTLHTCNEDNPTQGSYQSLDHA